MSNFNVIGENEINPYLNVAGMPRPIPRAKPPMPTIPCQLGTLPGAWVWDSLKWQWCCRTYHNGVPGPLVYCL